MRRIISWFNLLPAYEDFCRETLEELSAMLRGNYPNAPEIILERVSPNETEALSQLTTFRYNAATEAERACLNNYNGIFGFCANNEAFVTDVQLQNPLASWGAAMNGEFALVWTPNNKYLIWHEFLHLLYANDCYDSNGTSSCEEPHCIMQYIPNERNCNGSLTLCRYNYFRIVPVNFQ